MSGFGDEVMVRARLALSPEVAGSIEDQWAYRRWITHLCDLLNTIGIWATQLPTDSPALRENSVTVVLPELGAAAQRLRSMFPLDYWAYDFRQWQDFVIWCRTHPQYDAEGNPLSYIPAPEPQ